MLSTPQSRDHKGVPADGFNQANLCRDVANLLPTPRATDGTEGGPNQRGSSGDLMLPSAVSQLLPTPTARDGKDGQIRREPHRPDDTDTLSRALTVLLPTPAVNDMGASYTPDEWDAWTDRMKAEHGNGNGHGKSLSIEAQRVTAASYLDRVESMTADPVLLDRIQRQREQLLPTPTSADSKASGGSSASDVTLTDATVRTRMGTQPNERLLQTPSAADGLGGHERRGGSRGDELLLNGQAKEMHGADWGDYADAIHRWESILGRPAPAPTQTSTKGNPQLSPRFVEWMMGLTDGWVTDVPDMSRNECLKALGNGVVTQQAVEGVRRLLALAGAA